MSSQSCAHKVALAPPVVWETHCSVQVQLRRLVREVTRSQSAIIVASWCPVVTSWVVLFPLAFGEFFFLKKRTVHIMRVHYMKESVH